MSESPAWRWGGQPRRRTDHCASARYRRMAPNSVQRTQRAGELAAENRCVKRATHHIPLFMVPRTNAIHNMDTRHPTSDKERSARLQNQNRRRRRRRRRLLLQAAEDRIHHFEPDQRGWLGRVLREDTGRVMHL